MYEILIFCTPDARAQLESGSKLPLVIMSTMILDILKNIIYKKRKALWVKSHIFESRTPGDRDVSPSWKNLSSFNCDTYSMYNAIAHGQSKDF